MIFWRCSGSKPAFFPRKDGWTHGLAIVDFHQSDHCLLKSSRQKFISWSRFQTAKAKVLFDVACDRVLERFNLKSMKYRQRKAFEKLVNGKDVFVIQETGTGSINYFPVCSDCC